MFPSFRRYKEGTGGRGKIEPGPPVGSLASSRGFTGPLYWADFERASLS
jgi:hypothetical protein